MNATLTLWAVYVQDKDLVIPNSNEEMALLGGNPMNDTLARAPSTSTNITLGARQSIHLANDGRVGSTDLCLLSVRNAL